MFESARKQTALPAWLLSYRKPVSLHSGIVAGLSFLVVSLLPGTLLPRLPSEPGMTLLTIRIERIGLKDAGQCIDPYITVSVKGEELWGWFLFCRCHTAFHLEQLFLERWLPCLKQLIVIRSIMMEVPGIGLYSFRERF